MFEKCKEKLFKLLAFIHLLQNQAVTVKLRLQPISVQSSLPVPTS